MASDRVGYISSFSVIVSFIALSLLGCSLLPLLPVKLAPSESLPAITVSFNMPGSSARTVEAEATGRIESALARIPGVNNVNSRSRTGSGEVTLELDRNADISAARFEASMALRQVWRSLPSNASYPEISVRQVSDDSRGPFMSYTVNADVTPPQIMQYAERNLRPALSSLPGVAKVELSGAMPMEWRITYNNSLMSSLGITAQQLQKAISDSFGAEFLGLVQSGAGADGDEWMRVAISNPEFSTGANIGTIVIGSHHGRVVTIADVARIEHVEAQPYGYFRINGLNSIYLNITATDDANQIELSAEVRRLLSEISLPAGYMINLSYDASERISDELDKIYFRTGLTVLILLVFVGLITLSWRYLLLITISLSITMAVAVVAYYLLKVEIQLYSLAGITISLNLVIDNLIVMTEHITRRRNLRAFTAVLAATLTTIGALSVVFFLDEKTMLSLKDFVVVVIVNLAVSLLVALFLVPALIERLRLRSSRAGRRARMRRISVKSLRFYEAVEAFFGRHRAVVYTVFVLAFGLPVFLLPEKMEGEGRWAQLYNKTFGSKAYNESVRPVVDVCLGGTLRLFADKVTEGGYFNRGYNEPVVYISATLPNGATLRQMNALITRMERFLAEEDGVRQFQTSISGPRRGFITVYFKPEVQRTGYPYRLKSDVISKALTLGGGSWGVFGLEDQGFSNDVRESAGSYRVKLSGYNYDQLYSYAEQLRDSLLTFRRIREVIINSDFSYWKDDYTEFYLSISRELLARDSLSVNDLYAALSHDLGRNVPTGVIYGNDGAEQIRLSAADRDRDVWGLMNVPLNIGHRVVKLSDYATLDRRQAPPDVVKSNQEYVVCIQYEYVGSNTQGDKVLTRVLDQFNSGLPMGYRAEKGSYYWTFGKDPGHYALLALIAVIIFFISAILFNSLRQPLAIIMVIPVSFIGVFLTFYIFNLNFDQGGFAAFILLCGITVNAAIYIINEFNSLRNTRTNVPLIKLYMKAFSTKITAVMLTVLSTVLGFIPFLIGDVREGFWFPLAAGTMGGLIMSLVAIFVLLPLMVLPRQPRSKKVSGKRRRSISRFFKLRKKVIPS